MNAGRTSRLKSGSRRSGNVPLVPSSPSTPASFDPTNRRGFTRRSITFILAKRNKQLASLSGGRPASFPAGYPRSHWGCGLPPDKVTAVAIHFNPLPTNSWSPGLGRADRRRQRALTVSTTTPATLTNPYRRQFVTPRHLPSRDVILSFNNAITLTSSPWNQ